MDTSCAGIRSRRTTGLSSTREAGGSGRPDAVTSWSASRIVRTAPSSLPTCAARPLTTLTTFRTRTRTTRLTGTTIGASRTLSSRHGGYRRPAGLCIRRPGCNPGSQAGRSSRRPGRRRLPARRDSSPGRHVIPDHCSLLATESPTAAGPSTFRSSSERASGTAAFPTGGE
jgi:hypothetical protein